MRKTAMTNGIYCSPMAAGCCTGAQGARKLPAVPARGTLP